MAQSSQTPSQTIGPFFHYGLIFGGENDLLNDKTTGERLYIKGRVFDGDGNVVDDAMLEIWQADAHGYFNHPHDPNQAQADPHFAPFGRSDTTDEGFWFKTVKPGRLTGPDGQKQAPYINIRVFSRGMLTHAVTRLYFSDEPSNAGDLVMNSIPAERRATLIAQREDSADLPTYCFDIRLQGPGETVFFDL